MSNFFEIFEFYHTYVSIVALCLNQYKDFQNWSIIIVCWKLLYNLETFHLHHWQAYPMLSNYVHNLTNMFFFNNSSMCNPFVSSGNWNNLKWVGLVLIKCLALRIQMFNKVLYPKKLLCIFFLHLYKINAIKHHLIVLVLNKYCLYMICL